MNDFVFLSRGIDDAWVNYHKTDKWDLYCEGYKKAGFYLVEEILRNMNNSEYASDLDELIYPISYVFRHYLEIRLKSILVEFHGEEIATKKIKQYGHSLKKSWADVKEIFTIMYEDELKEGVLNKVENYILEIDDIDNLSFAFRYPVDRKNTEVLDEKRISYSNLNNCMEYISNCLDSLYGKFYENREDI